MKCWTFPVYLNRDNLIVESKEIEVIRKYSLKALNVGESVPIQLVEPLPNYRNHYIPLTSEEIDEIPEGVYFLHEKMFEKQAVCTVYPGFGKYKKAKRYEIECLFNLHDSLLPTALAFEVWTRRY